MGDGGRGTLYSGSMSSSISLPVRVRTLGRCVVSVAGVRWGGVGWGGGGVLDVHGWLEWGGEVEGGEGM